MSTISTTLSSERNLSGVGADTGMKAPTQLGKSRLWVWFLVAFCVQISAWTAWITIASHHKVQEVPLAQPAAPRQ